MAQWPANMDGKLPPPALNGTATEVIPGNFPRWSARLLGGCSRSRRDGLAYNELCVSCLATEISRLRRRAAAGKKPLTGVR